MNWNHLSILIILVSVRLQCSIAQDVGEDLEEEQGIIGSTASAALEMEMTTTYEETKREEEPAIEPSEPEQIMEPTKATAAGMSVELLELPASTMLPELPATIILPELPATTVSTSTVLPTLTESLVESTHAPDYQDDAPEIEEVTTPKIQNKPLTIPELVTQPASQDLAPLPKMTCFNCSSYQGGNCFENPTSKMTCRNAASGSNGCYTLIKRDTKLIMRGCLSELTLEGQKYCNTEERKLCQQCYNTECNKDLPPATGSAQILTNLSLGSLCVFVGVLYVILD